MQDHRDLANLVLGGSGLAQYILSTLTDLPPTACVDTCHSYIGWGVVPRDDGILGENCVTDALRSEHVMGVRAMHLFASLETLRHSFHRVGRPSGIPIRGMLITGKRLYGYVTTAGAGGLAWQVVAWYGVDSDEQQKVREHIREERVKGNTFEFESVDVKRVVLF